jgi:hypothetical protein
MRDKLTHYLIFLSLLVVTFTSCRYSAPFVKFRTNRDTIYDGNSKILTKKYIYFRISRYGLFGKYNKTSVYQNDKLDSITLSKHSTSRKIYDGVQTSIIKTIKYSKDSISGKNNRQTIDQKNLLYIKSCCKGYFKKRVSKSIIYNSTLKRQKFVKKEINSNLRF